MRLFPSTSLRRLVLQHRDACAAVGLDARAVIGEDDSAVERWLRERANLLPSPLAEDLERIDELSTDKGAATLLLVGKQAGVDLARLGLDPTEVAVTAFLDHRALFDQAHGKRVVETLRGTTDFPGRSAALPVPFDDARVAALEARLGAQFEARARSAHCRITVGRDGDRVVFTVAHGAMMRAEESLDCAPLMVRDSAVPVYLTERTLRYRPQRRDIVVYDACDGLLRIRAGDAPTLRAYRRGFGELLHRDAEWFGDDEIVSLEPLIRLGRAVELPIPGVTSIRLVGLIVHYATGPEGRIAIDSGEIWPFLEQRVRPGLEEGELVEASFRVLAEGSSSAVLTRIRAPRRVESGKADDALFRRYLEARGFLAAAAGSAAT